MANFYSAIINDSDYWDGTTAWAYDATSDFYNPTAHANQGARDVQYVATYTTVALWEDARDGTNGAGDVEFGIIQGPWGSGSWETTAVVISAFAADSYVLRAIGVARPTDGVWDTTDAYGLVATTATIVTVLSSAETGIIDGLQIGTICIGSFENNSFAVSATADTIITDCILRGTQTGNSAGGFIGFYENYNGDFHSVIGCFIYFDDAGFSISGNSHTGILNGGSTFLVYNCSFVNLVTFGVNDDSTMTVKNCVFADNGNDTDGVNTTDYNATDEGAGEGTNGIDISATWNTTCFADAVNWNFNVQDIDSPVYLASEITQTDDANVPDHGIGGNARNTDAGQQTSIGAFELVVAGGINYEDLLLGVSISASVSEIDAQQMSDTLKDVSIAASVTEADNQQMLDTNKAVSFAASVSETDTQQMVDTSLGVTVVASLNVADNQQMLDTNKAVSFAADISVADTRQMFDIDLSVSFAASITETDNQQMKDLLKDVSFAASISEIDTQQMKDLLKAVTFAASCDIETEVYYDASAVVVAMFAFIILRQHTS